MAVPILLPKTRARGLPACCWAWARHAALPAPCCRMVPAELGVLPRWHQGGRDSRAAGLGGGGCCSVPVGPAVTVQEPSVVGTQHRGWSCCWNPLAVPWAMVAPWLCPFGAVLQPPPAGDDALMPASTQYVMAMMTAGLTVMGSRAAGPHHTLWGPLYLPIAPLVCPSPGETSVPRGAALVSEAVYQEPRFLMSPGAGSRGAGAVPRRWVPQGSGVLAAPQHRRTGFLLFTAGDGAECCSRGPQGSGGGGLSFPWPLAPRHSPGSAAASTGCQRLPRCGAAGSECAGVPAPRPTRS